MLGNNSETVSNDMDISCSSIDEVKHIRGRLSLKLLNTLDPYIESIIHQTPFVTGYRMTNDEKWSRMGIEGFLYVVNRTKKPIHSFILINKKSEDHLIEYITPEFQMNRNGNYIFYRSKDIENNSMNLLQGLWFFDENECKSTYEKLCDITNNKSPLQYSLSSINSLYNNMNEVTVETQTKKQTTSLTQDNNNRENKDKLKDESPKIKSIGSFLLDTISFKSAKLKQEKKEKEENNKRNNEDKEYKDSNYTENKDSNNILKTIFKKTDEQNQKTNLEGKHLMTLLKSSVKTEQNKLQIQDDKIKEREENNKRSNENKEYEYDTSKMISNLDIGERILTNVIQNKTQIQEKYKEYDYKINVNYQTLKEVMLEVAQSDEFISMVWEKLKNRTS